MPIVVAAIAGFAAVTALTTNGANTSPDSASYVGAARSVVGGLGFTLPWGSPPNRPLVHFPPLYPAILAFIGFFGPDPLSAARWLNAFLFAANIALVGSAVWFLTRSALFGGIAAVLMLSSPAMLLIHSFAWSEPLFIFLAVAALTALCLYVRRPSGRLLTMAAAATALAFLCRWAGAPLAAAGLITVGVFAAGGWARRLSAGALFGLASCAPVGLWILRSISASGSATNRTLTFHPVSARHVADGAYMLAGWVAPSLEGAVRLRYLLLLALVVIVGGVLLAARSARAAAVPSGKALREAPWPFAAFGALYCAFLLLSLSFLDHATPVDARIMAPAYVAWVVSVLWLWSPALRPAPTALVWRPAALGFWLLVAALQVSAGATFIAQQQGGMGYIVTARREPGPIPLVWSLPPEAALHSNRPEDVYMLAGRLARSFPARMDLTSGRPSARYREDLAEAMRGLARPDGRLVMIEDGTERWPDETELQGALQLTPVAEGATIRVYSAPR